MLWRISWRGRAYQQTLRLTRLWRCITTLSGATRDDELGDALPQCPAEAHQLIAQQICINGNGEALTPILQPLQMAFDQPRLATCDANSLEQPIAVGQSSIMNGPRSEERREGKEWVSTSRSWW